MKVVAPTSANKSFHARLLARLDDAGLQQAEKRLRIELAKNPADHASRLSLCFVLQRKGDYSGAAAAAHALLDFQGDPRPTAQQLDEARFVWHSTKDRRANVAAKKTGSPSIPSVQTGSKEVDDRPAVLAVKFGRRTSGEVPLVHAIEGDERIQSPESSRWLWLAGWSVILIGGAWVLLRKLSQKKLIAPIVMTGTGILLLGISLLFPPGSPVTTPEGVTLIFTPAAARVAIVAAGSALTAKGAVETGRALMSTPNGNASSNESPTAKSEKPTVESRIKDADLPTEGEFRFEPPKRYRPGNKLPVVREGRTQGYGYEDRYGNIWRKGDYHGKPGKFKFEWDVELSDIGKRIWKQFARGKGYINIRPDGVLSH